MIPADSRLVPVKSSALRVGDFCEALVPEVLNPAERNLRRCVVVGIVVNIIQISTATRKDIVAIARSNVRRAWGLRSPESYELHE